MVDAGDRRVDVADRLARSAWLAGRLAQWPNPWRMDPAGPMDPLAPKWIAAAAITHLAHLSDGRPARLRMSDGDWEALLAETPGLLLGALGELPAFPGGDPADGTLLEAALDSLGLCAGSALEATVWCASVAPARPSRLQSVEDGTPMTEHPIQSLLGGLTPVHERIAPRSVYVAGDVKLVRETPKMAVVGSRQATSEGLENAARVTRALVSLDTTVVSGLADGIDTVAHRSAIEGGGRTFAVIGTGFDRAYPAKNRALQAHLASHYAVVSQFAPGSPVTRANFPQRNRTMALLSDALVIVEAAEKSGTINQAWEALRIGRSVLLLETVAENADLTWPSKMLCYGAEVLRLSHLEAQLREVPWVTAFGEAIF